MPEGEAYFFRHSKGKYGQYHESLKGDNPVGGLDYKKQPDIDLTPEGIELAEKQAGEFLLHLNPGADRFFIVSSKEARAIGTADIYRRKAKEMGFEVIKSDESSERKEGSAKPKLERSPLAEKIGEKEIRTLDTLSLHPTNMLWFQVFDGQRPEVNWGAVDVETRNKWEEARKIIEADNRKTWGANFGAHSEQIKKITPEIVTAAEFHETKFKNLMRLLRWAENKVEGVPGKKIKILAFGHEDYVLHFLEQEFKEEGINNCEMIRFNVDGENITANFRGKSVRMK